MGVWVCHALTHCTLAYAGGEGGEKEVKVGMVVKVKVVRADSVLLSAAHGVFRPFMRLRLSFGFVCGENVFRICC